MKYTTTLFLFLGFCLGLQAQVIEVAPTQNNKLIEPYRTLNNYSQRTGNDTLSLPFLDDFSYSSVYPSMDNWCDNDAYVNPTFGFNPPTIGVATLDGLDAAGSPYGVNGSGDTLTSLPFFLGSYTASDNVFLSFFYQAKGNGDKPEPEDILALEFYDANGNWNEFWRWEGIDGTIVPNTFIPDFEFFSIAVPAAYLYDGFQFRFRNEGSGQGQVDLWHLDYIRLTDSNVPTEQFNDVAFTEQAPTFLSRYTAMPWQQFEDFENSEMTDEYTLTLYNHFPVVQEIQTRTLSVMEAGGTSVLSTSYLNDANPPIPLGNVNPGFHLQAQKQIDGGSYASFLSNMQTAFAGASDLEFTTTFSFTQTGQDPAFPASFDNDVISRKTVFGDYYAYDDGTAESNVKAQNTGTQVAVKYTLNKADTLKAIRFNIPHVAGDATLQLFNIYVYTDLNAAPVYEATFQSPVYVNDFENDTLQGFATYVLEDAGGNDTPLFLPAGDFYVGWQQFTATSTPIPVGFDKNNPEAGQYNFFNSGGGWSPFPATIQGAVMIRPVVGDAIVFNTSTEDLTQAEGLSIFPNPSRHEIRFQVEGGYKSAMIFDALGRNVLTTNSTENINISSLANGLYFIHLIQDNNQVSHIGRFTVQR